MSDILHGFTPSPPPPLTAHMHHHLRSGLRVHLARAEAQRAALPRTRHHRTEAQAARYWHLTDVIQGLEADLAEMEAQ